MNLKRIAAITVALSVIAVSCGSDSNDTPAATDGTTVATTQTDSTTADSTTADSNTVTADAPFPAARCEANKAAGKITYLSSFDFSASASIVDVIVAKDRGYFDALCLDVELKASFSTANYPLIAGNEAQFSSGGSFSEVVSFATDNADADVVALAVEGHTGIDALFVKDGEATQLSDLKGSTIGVKGKITPSVQAMLAKAGLIEGTDYQTVPVEGFDPLVHMALPNIVGFPGYKSNEAGKLERAGIKYTLFDPAADGIPGSFGVLYTNGTFMKDHPTAVEDFMRATMLGLADAIADPAAAAKIALALIDSNGNPNFLSPEGENFKWASEAKLVTDSTPAGSPVGLADAAGLQNEVDAYAAIGLFGGTAPDISKRFNTSVLTSIYDSAGKVIWPSK